MSRHLILGTAGHVDHGKTALIKALTDFDCDTHKEEKERGITINLGFSNLTLPTGNSIGIVDVPGHKDFIKTMVAGAYGIDFVLFVIAADSGVMPQTIEHLNIIRMLGVKHGVVALNKIDLVDEEMVELAKLEVMEMLEGTELEEVPVVGVSAISGQGIEDLIEALESQIDNIPEKSGKGSFRMFIDRIFNVKGLGSVVTGSVLGGETQTGKDLFLLPGLGRKVKVKNIERHGEKVDKVITGDRAALNLTGLKPGEFKRGMILSEQPIPEVSMVDAVISLFDVDVKLEIWSTVIFLTGTFETQAKIHLINCDELDKDGTAIVQIHLEKPYILVDLDKFIIRNSSNDMTLGGGTVFDVSPQHHRRRTPQLIKQLEVVAEASLHSGNFIEMIRLDLVKSKKPLPFSFFEKKYDVSPEDIFDACRDRKDQFTIYRSGDTVLLIDPASDSANYDFILEELKDWHQKNPLNELGLEEKVFISKLGLPGDESSKQYISGLIDKQLQAGLIKRIGNTRALIDHAVRVDARTREHLDWLEREIRNCGPNKPLLEEIEEAAKDEKIPKDRIRKMIIYLAKEGKLILHEADFVHKSYVDQCRTALLRELSKQERGINEKAFRELLDCSKKMTQLLIGIYEKEGIISRRSFYIDITEFGRKILAEEPS